MSSDSIIIKLFYPNQTRNKFEKFPRKKIKNSQFSNFFKIFLDSSIIMTDAQHHKYINRTLNNALVLSKQRSYFFKKKLRKNQQQKKNFFSLIGPIFDVVSKKVIYTTVINIYRPKNGLKVVSVYTLSPPLARYM